MTTANQAQQYANYKSGARKPWSVSIGYSGRKWVAVTIDTGRRDKYHNFTRWFNVASKYHLSWSIFQSTWAKGKNLDQARADDLFVALELEIIAEIMRQVAAHPDAHDCGNGQWIFKSNWSDIRKLAKA